MSKTFFDHLNQIVKYKKTNYWNNLSEEDRKTWNTFMMNRYLSMNLNWTVVVDFFQKYNHALSDRLSYILYVNYIPKTNIFLKYIKKDKSEKNSEIIKYISKYYLCSLSEASEYLYLLSKEDLNKILEDFGLDKKLISKLLKDVKNEQ